MRENPVDIPSGEATLKGTLFWPDGQPRGAVLISAATAIPHGYYQHFARWLCEETERAVLTFDYRDFASSRSRAIQRSKATMVDWAVDDIQAARSFLLERVPNGDLWWRRRQRR